MPWLQVIASYPNLKGGYNNLESSYLYSPCFDLSNTTSPYLLFNVSLDIENCGADLCDEAHVEYSTDDSVWTKLGKAHEGINWYNDSTYQVWTIEDKNAWQKAAIDLPKGLGKMRLRFVLNTDPGASFEGIGVDDLEIIDKVQVPKLVGVFPNPNRDGKFTIYWNGTEGVEMKLIIFDAMGREVYTGNVISNYPHNNTTVQTPHFSSGVYLMKCYIDGKKFETKLVYQ